MVTVMSVACVSATSTSRSWGSRARRGHWRPVIGLRGHERVDDRLHVIRWWPRRASADPRVVRDCTGRATGRPVPLSAVGRSQRAGCRWRRQGMRSPLEFSPAPPVRAMPSPPRCASRSALVRRQRRVGRHDHDDRAGVQAGGIRARGAASGSAHEDGTTVEPISRPTGHHRSSSRSRRRSSPGPARRPCNHHRPPAARATTSRCRP